MAAVALPWLVFIIFFFMHIQAQQLPYPMAQIPIIQANIETVNAQDVPFTGIFPRNLFPLPCPPINLDPVGDITQWFNDDKETLERANGTLKSSEPTPAQVDWDVTLYQAIIAYIVNFRGPKDDLDPLKNIKEAASVFGLKYKSFTDLAWVQHPIFNHSGPFCGVFFSEGPNPFMILSFKGTTNGLEAITNAYALPSTQTNGVLYNQAVHLGMYNGLFIKFPTLDDPAIDVIWSNLTELATELQGENQEKVPLYISGHSLGAGYAQLAYVELYRKLQPGFDMPFNLKSLYAFAAPRVGVISGTGLANKVHEEFEGSNKPIFRYSVQRDVVPFSPGIITYHELIGNYTRVWGFTHLDNGYILHRDKPNSLGEYFTNEDTERCKLPKNDPVGRACWEYHFPQEYYHSIKKILDPSYPDLPTDSLKYQDINGECVERRMSCVRF